LIDLGNGIKYNTTMKDRVVIDTNVLVAAIRSRKGASFRILSLVGKGRFDLVLSVPLVLEYEDAMKRSSRSAGLRYCDIDDILDFICKIGEHREIYFLWRPFLKDPKDDMVLELAVESGCELIVTHNLKDFAGADGLGVKVVRPVDFLRKLGEVS